MYKDFGAKFICVILMHLVTAHNMNSALDLIRYLRQPPVFEHIFSSRFLSTLILMLKFFSALVAETILILILSKIKETDEVRAVGQLSSILEIILTFVVILCIYEAPTLIFRTRLSQT